MKADGLDLSQFDLDDVREVYTSRNDKNKHLYLDSDTLINKRLDEIFDIIAVSPREEDVKIPIDLFMVQEYNWHRDLSPFLYEPVLRSEISPLQSIISDKNNRTKNVFFLCFLDYKKIIQFFQNIDL